MPLDLESLVDRKILSCAARQWQKTTMLVATVLRLCSDAEVDEEYIATRIETLIEQQRLESRGNVSNWRHSEIRLSQ
jgi:hypothetical protein